MKYMSVKEFRELGLLHEVNRLVLHPLGLALEVRIDDDGNESFGQVWDDRDDPEGIYYGDDLLSPEKAKAVCDLMLSRRGERLTQLNYVIQPIRDVRSLTVRYIDPIQEALRDDEIEFEQ
jgi:hypothetical protein